MVGIFLIGPSSHMMARLGGKSVFIIVFLLSKNNPCVILIVNGLDNDGETPKDG